MKGVILTAGKATRLRPITDCYGKVLVPIYDKPMIFYGVSLLFGAGVDEIAIVCNESDRSTFCKLFSDEIYKNRISFFVQKEALGTAHAIKYAKDFVGEDDFVLLFGDNIFVMKDMHTLLSKAIKDNAGLTLFAKEVQDPQRFGVVEFDKNNNVISIEEKPEHPKTNFASAGLYVCNNRAMKEIDGLKKSPRGEYEFTDVIVKYVKEKRVKVCPLPKKCKYLDTGTFDALLECSNFVKKFEAKNGLFGCVELELYRSGKINKEQFEKSISHYAKDYKERIMNSLQ